MNKEEVEEIIANFKKFCEESGGQLSEEISSLGIYQATCRYDEQKDMDVLIADFFHAEEGVETRLIDIQLSSNEKSEIPMSRYARKEPAFRFRDVIKGHHCNYVYVIFEKTPVEVFGTDNINKDIRQEGILKVKEIELKINMGLPCFANPQITLRG